MSDQDESGDPRGGKLDSIFGGEADFGEVPSTPEDGRVRLTDEEAAVLDKIDALKEEQPGVYDHESEGVGYIPVGDSMLPYLERRRREGKGFTVQGKDLKWWSDNGMLPKHPFILLNPTTIATRNYHYDAGIVRDWLGLDRGDTFVLADSGGFQIVRESDEEPETGRFEMTEEIQKHDWQDYIHAHRVLEWQMANADAGTIVDVPVYRTWLDNEGFGTDDYSEWYNGLFQNSLDRTVRNTELAVERYEEIDYDDFMLMPVLHGMPRQDNEAHALQSHREWFERMDALHDWDGWSLSVRQYDSPGLNTLMACFALEHLDDADYFHLLGLGSAWARIVCKFLSVLSDSFVTMDGTGFKIGSIYSTMYLPTSYMKSVRMTNRDQDGEDVRYEVLEPHKMPCGCSVCRRIEQDMGAAELFEKPGTERMVLMDLHNLGHLLRRFYLIDSFIEARGIDIMDEAEVVERDDGALPIKIKPKSEFWRLVSDWFSKARVVEIYLCMDLMRRTKEEGFDSAFEDYGIRTPFNQGLPDSYDECRPSIYSTKWDGLLESQNSVFNW